MKVEKNALMGTLKALELAIMVLKSEIKSIKKRWKRK